MKNEIIKIKFKNNNNNNTVILNHQQKKIFLINIQKKFYFVVVDQGHIANINNITIENSKIQKKKRSSKSFFFIQNLLPIKHLLI